MSFLVLNLHSVMRLQEEKNGLPKTGIALPKFS